MRREWAGVVVIGAGPAGCAAATELRRRGVEVLVIERESEPGGIPRHAQHQGFGLRDLRRVLPGPRYAHVIADRASRAGAELRLNTQVTGWLEDGALAVTGPGGRTALAASAVVLATGCRERPRSARLVAGSRPEGVMSSGMLQQLVYLRGRKVGGRAVVVGAEHVSFSALLTLAHGGARPVLMTTELARHQTLAVFRAGAALRFGVPVRTRTALTAIHGHRRVEAVELTNLGTGKVETVECDTVVFTGDWVPDHELAALGGAALDPGTCGPVVDAALRTSRPGLFAAGNVLHGAETADVAALGGRHVAAGVVEHLDGSAWPDPPVRFRCEPPLQWIVPGAVSRVGGPPRNRYLVRATEELHDVQLALIQDGRTVHRERLLRIMPGRSGLLRSGWVREVDARGGPVMVRVTAARRRRGPLAG